MRAVKFQSALCKIKKNSKIFKQDSCLTNVKHQLHVKSWRMCVTLLLLIAADWFSPIIVSQVACI